MGEQKQYKAETILNIIDYFSGLDRMRRVWT
jgi:hypothetical protein